MTGALESVQNQALTAYVTLLQQKGVPTGAVNQRKHFLRYVLRALKDRPINGQSFRLAVDETLPKFAADKAALFQGAAREFYYFWIGDLRAVARMNANDEFLETPVEVKVRGSLLDMLADMDAAQWEGREIPTLDSYLLHLKEHGVSQAAMDIRERMLRLLHFVMRDLEPSAKHYRHAVDAMLPLFSKEETCTIFIALAREYYYFWIERPALSGSEGGGEAQMTDKKVAF